MSKVNLETFAGGALQEKFDRAFNQVMENMHDPNTSFKNKRVITIKVAMLQNELRDDATAQVSVEAKLAPVIPIETKLTMERDLVTGEIFVEEYGKGIKGQISLGDIAKESDVKVIDGQSVDVTTGEIVDFKAARKA